MRKITIATIALFLWLPVFGSTATDICNENFDKTIKEQTQQKKNLKQLITEAKSKITAIKAVYKETDEFYQTIMLLTKTNLIKSTLKLGYDTYKELQPLTGVEGKLAEISAWLVDKAKSYAESEGKKVLGLTTKDYYDKHIELMKRSLESITPEVKLLNQMLDAGLEAFKIKMYRETNQTIGDVGALYFKLRSLAEQSLKAKRSLYKLYSDMHNLIEGGKHEIAHLEIIIDAYKETKNRTCREHKDPEIKKEKIELVDIYENPHYEAKQLSDTCSEIDWASIENTLDTLVDDRNKTYNLFLDKYKKDIAGLRISVDEFVESEENKTIKGYKDTSLSSISYLNPKMKLEGVYSQAKNNHNSNIKMWENQIDALLEHKSFADNFIKEQYGSTLFKDLKEKDIEVRKKATDYYSWANICNRTNTKYFPVTIIDGATIPMHADVEAIYKDYLKNIDRLKLNLEYLKNSTSIEDEYKDWQFHLKRDKIDIDILIEKLSRKMYLFHKVDRSISEMTDYMEDQKIIKISQSYEAGIQTTYIYYGVNWDYVAELYDQFSGNPIDFVEILKEKLRSVNAKAIPLLSKIKETEALLAAVPATEEDVKSIASRSSRPAVNINFSELEAIVEKIRKRRFQHTYITYANRYIDALLGGKLVGNVPILLRIHSDIQKEESRLKQGIESGITLIENIVLKSFKALILKGENFQYKLGNSLNGYEEANREIVSTIKSAKKVLKTTAEKKLNIDQAKEYDLDALNLNCKESLMEINVSKHTLTTVSNDTETIDIALGSCDGSKLTLEADVLNDKEGAIVLKSNWIGKKITSYGSQSEKLYITSSCSEEKLYEVRLKLTNSARAVLTKEIKIKCIPSTEKHFVKKGWSLVGGAINLDKLPSDIDIVWLYKNSTWYARSPNSKLNHKIKEESIAHNIEALEFTENNEGAWIHAKNDTYIDVADMVGAEDDKVHVSKKWWTIINASVPIDSFSQITCGESSPASVVTYASGEKGDSFMYYAEDKNNTRQINIDKGSAFWVLCK